MKRLVYALVLVLLGGGVWSAVDNFRIKHPVSGREVTVPGQNGPNAMLVSGWKTTPAGRQLPSGDMILSGQVSPDGKLFAFTNTGYTRHGLHIVDLATEKEIATFPTGAGLERAGVRSGRQADLRLERRGLSGQRHPVLRSLGQGRLEGSARGLHASSAPPRKDRRLLARRLGRRQAPLRAQQLRRPPLHPRNPRRPRGRAAQGR